MQRVAALYKGESIDITRDMKIRVVSTFNGMGNKFFDLWERRKENGYSGHLVTIYDAVAKVCRSTSRSCGPASMIRTRGRRSTSASRPTRATSCCLTI
jgi:phage FluMu gp28-like protein